jgi:hypothetical protein
LEEYDLEIVFNKGVSNTNADALSCVSSLVAEEGVTEEKRQRIIDEETKVIFNDFLTVHRDNSYNKNQKDALFTLNLFK